MLATKLGVALDVYGSHATQLCLHWSDIDLVVFPMNSAPGTQGYNAQGGGNPSGRSFAAATSLPSNSFNGRHLLLDQVYEELRKDEHSSWISKV